MTRSAVRKDTRQKSFSSKSSIGALESTGHLILLILLSTRCLRLFISVSSHCGSKCLHSSYKRRYCLRSASSLHVCFSCSCNALKMNSVSSTFRCFRKNFHIATPPGRPIKLSRQSLGGLVSRSRPSWKRPITVGSWSVYSMAQRGQKATLRAGRKATLVIYKNMLLKNLLNIALKCQIVLSVKSNLEEYTHIRCKTVPKHNMTPSCNIHLNV